MTTLEPQIQATRTLVKFCADHGYDVKGVDHIRTCLRALEKKNIAAAVDAFQKIPLGGMGCFNDWIPNVKSENETPQYVADLFEVLVAYWNLTMKKLQTD